MLWFGDDQFYAHFTVDYPSSSYETSTVITVSFSILMPTHPCYQPTNNKWPREPFCVPRVLNPIGITVKPGQSFLPLVDRKGTGLSCLAPYLFMSCYSGPPLHWLTYLSAHSMNRMRVISYHIISYHIILYHITSHHIIYHIISYLIISYHH